MKVRILTHLTPGARKPFCPILTGAAVTRLELRGALQPTAIQGQAADEVFQTQDTTGLDSHATLSRALRTWGQRSKVSAGANGLMKEYGCRPGVLC